MFSRIHTTLLAAGLSLFGACAAEGVGEDDPELNSVRQAAVASMNGLRAINGLRTRNGLVAINGLTTSNGLRVRNGLRTINGLRTFNGLRTRNGLEVDCAGKTAGVSCTGEPDGLLSAATGLMSDDEGINVAKYVIRCALPKNDSIRVKDYTGGLVSLSGELGLASSWKDGDCDNTCQERVSACLMALTNGDGKNVEVELAAPFVLGTGHSFRYQEAAFYGNLFLDNPEAYYCVGKDYAQNGIRITLLEERSCEGYNERDGSCPFKRVGFCNNAISLSLSDNTLTGDNKCSFSGDTAKGCKDSSSSSGGLLGGLSLLSRGKTWANPITTFRKTRE
jgi:hypothetical protein